MLWYETGEVSWGPGYEESCFQQGWEFKLHFNAMESLPRFLCRELTQAAKALCWWLWDKELLGQRLGAGDTLRGSHRRPRWGLTNSWARPVAVGWRTRRKRKMAVQRTGLHDCLNVGTMGREVRILARANRRRARWWQPHYLKLEGARRGGVLSLLLFA